MTSTKPLTASERYARLILSAWNKRELTELRAALTQMPFIRTETLPFVECERMDLLRDLGQSLLASEHSGHFDNRANHDAALGLVRHLARCE
jgi:hypothetical protein